MFDDGPDLDLLQVIDDLAAAGAAGTDAVAQAKYALTASESVEDSADRSIWRWTIAVRGGP